MSVIYRILRNKKLANDIHSKLSKHMGSLRHVEVVAPWWGRCAVVMSCRRDGVVMPCLGRCVVVVFALCWCCCAVALIRCQTQIHFGHKYIICIGFGWKKINIYTCSYMSKIKLMKGKASSSSILLKLPDSFLQLNDCNCLIVIFQTRVKIQNYHYIYNWERLKN